MSTEAREAEDAALAKLSSWLSDAASETETIRVDAMSQLHQFQKSGWVAVWLMKLMVKPDTDPLIVLAGAIQLKNVVRDRWEKYAETESEEEEEEEEEEGKNKSKSKNEWISMSDGDRRCIHQNSIGLLLIPHATPAIRRQVGETIMIVAGVEPHERWPSFWPELRARLRAADIWTLCNGDTKVSILVECLAAVLQNITTFGLDEEGDEGDAILAVRAASVEIGEMVITILIETAGRLALCPPPSVATSMQQCPEGPSARDLLRVLHLTTYTLCTLNALEMVECMQNRLGSIFPPLAALFAMPPISQSVNENDRGWNVAAIALFEELRIAICDLGTLFASHYESEFAPFLGAFTRTVWNAVVHAHSSLSDDLASSTIAFLTIALSRGACPVAGVENTKPEITVLTLSGRAAPTSGWAVGALNVDTITQVLDGVIIPQLIRRAERMEEIARRPSSSSDDEIGLEEWAGDADLIDELNGADFDSRRGMVLDFLRTLRVANPAAATMAVAGAVKKCLSGPVPTSEMSDSKSGPTDQKTSNTWLQKDVAASLLLAFCARGWSKIVTKAKETSPAEDPGIQLFLDQVAFPELSNLDVNLTPALKADCLRFVCGFRLHIEVDDRSRLLLDVARCLRAQNSRTRAIAAVALDRVLSTVTSASPALEYAAPEMMSILESLASGSAAKRGASAAVRRVAYSAATRVVHVLGKGLGMENTNVVLPSFASHLRMPGCGTNDSLCVLLDVLVRRMMQHLDMQASAARSAAIEKSLLPPLLSAMEDDELPESHSSILDVITTMLECAPEASTTFVSLYPSWVLPKWYKGGRQAALARLLCMYLQKVPGMVWANDQAKPLLGVFHKLLGSGSTVKAAMTLLSAADERLPPSELWSAHGVALIRLLWARLNQSRTNETDQGLRYARLLGRFVLSHGARRGFVMLKAAADQVSPSSLEIALRDRLLPALSPITASAKHPISDSEKAIDIALLTAVLTRASEPDAALDKDNRSPFALARSAVISSSEADATWNDVGALWLNGIAGVLRLCTSTAESKIALPALAQAMAKFSLDIAIIYRAHSARLGPIFARSLSQTERDTLTAFLVRH